MVTVKELAKEAGVSPSTVSIVLGGKSEERKITTETQRRVWEASKKLGYRPNISARRLRLGPDDSLVLAVFWAADFRAPMMVRFLRGLQAAVLTWGKHCEIIIHTYSNDGLAASLRKLGNCDAAIICNASPADMIFLHSQSFPVPMVLYNRHSEKFCTVNVDDERMGTMASEIFASRKHKNAALLSSDSVFQGMATRNTAFIQAAEAAGLSVLRLHQENSMSGGYQGGIAIASLRPMPDCLFCISDALAVGALRAFGKQGIRVPEDIEIISVGNGDRELEEYASVSLSVVHLPMEDMAEACFRLVLELIEGETQDPHSIELPVVYRQRESCGG